MPKFSYAILQDDQRKEGVLEALDRDAALRQLGADGAVLVKLEPLESMPSTQAGPISRGGSLSVPVDELLAFSYEMSSSLAAGIPLTQALELLAKGFRGHRLESALQDLTTGTREGRSLSEAMTRRPDVFSDLYINMVRAGEASGTLPTTFERLGRTLEKQEFLAEQVRTALTYPAVVAGFAVLMSFGMLVIGTSQLSAMYGDLAIHPPLLTRVLIWLGGWFTHYWWAVLIGLVGVIWGCAVGVRSAAARRWFERIVSHSRLTEPLTRDYLGTTFASTFGGLYERGIPVDAALMLTGPTLALQSSRVQLEEARKAVLEGASLQVALERCTFLPPALVGMLATGQQTGSLGESLRRAASFYEGRFDMGLRRLTATLEPLLMIAVSVCVGGVVILLAVPFLTLSFSLMQP